MADAPTAGAARCASVAEEAAAQPAALPVRPLGVRQRLCAGFFFLARLARCAWRVKRGFCFCLLQSLVSGRRVLISSRSYRRPYRAEQLVAH